MSKVPVYATRPSAGGIISTFSMNEWLALAIFALVWINILGWSIVGLVTLIEKLVSLLG